MTRTCCFIPESQQADAQEGKVVAGCGREALWQIYGSPNESVDSCTAHVGELLSDAPVHTIWPIDET